MGDGYLPPGVSQADIDRAHSYVDDYDGYDEDDDCAHEEFDEDSELTRTCCRCGERWMVTAEELERDRRREVEYTTWDRRERRREFWRRLTYPVRWPVYRLLERIWPRQSCRVLRDDEIPF